MSRKSSSSRNVLSTSCPGTLQRRRSRPSESWEDFHQQYHSEEFRRSTSNPSVLRLVGVVGRVPNSFYSGKELKTSLVDQILLRDDSMSACSGSSGSHTGSDHVRSRRRMDERSSKMWTSSKRRSQGNIKIGQPPKQTKTWSFPFSSFFSKASSSSP
jgi:hypothetical protein